MGKKVKVSLGILLIISGLVLIYLVLKGEKGIYFYIVQIAVIVLSIINIVNAYNLIRKK